MSVKLTEEVNHKRNNDITGKKVERKGQTQRKQKIKEKRETKRDKDR